MDKQRDAQRDAGPAGLAGVGKVSPSASGNTTSFLPYLVDG